MEHRVEAALAEQLAFYRLAAAAFNRHRTGVALDEANSRLRGVMDLSGDVLEIACGAGQWTARLAETARFVTAIDAAPEMVAFTRQRLAGRSADRVEVVCADIFDWWPQAPLPSGALRLLAVACASRPVQSLLGAGGGMPGARRHGGIR